MRAVAYYRVSTSAQGRSGLGLEAQRQAVQQMARQRALDLTASFTEVESGKRDDRPQLAEALQLAKLTGAVLVIAKLDRLSRSASFLLALRDSGARFLAADIPDANDLTIGVLAVIAQAEREAISRRTKEALAAVIARITAEGSHTSSRTARTVRRLGNPNGSASLRRAGKGNAAARAAVARHADRRASELSGMIAGLRAGGHRSYPALARALNDRGVLTPRGGHWHPATVRNLLLRLDRH